MFYGKKISNKPLISVIIDTFNRPNELKNTIDHILDQTYQNIEIVLVDNAANKITKKYIENLRKNNKFKFLTYEKNQFSFEDPQRMIKIISTNLNPDRAAPAGIKGKNDIVKKY